MKALISVYDKSGLDKFASVLEEVGYELISTGGTYDYLKAAGFHPEKLSNYCESPELLGGRVKSLHPVVFAGILARADQEDELVSKDISRIDLVCCNLYPFSEIQKNSSDEETILENIDIGGVALLRAASKNYKKVISVPSPKLYSSIADMLLKNNLDETARRRLAAETFRIIFQYDASIAAYLFGDRENFLSISEEKNTSLRYGENPHQKAALYGNPPYKQLAGKKELSFNNYQDMDAAVRLVNSFEEPASAVIKHAVACGAAVSKDIKGAFIDALSGDPISAFGGIIGFNRICDASLASEVIKTFFEVVAGPGFTSEALEILKQKPNLRVIQTFPLEVQADIRQITGGFLLQEPDNFVDENWKVVTEKHPSEEEMKDLKIAWKIAGFLKSNAIALVSDGKTVGLGSGQTSRVDSVRIAADSMRRRAGSEKRIVMASDGFFPFPDGVEEAAAAGVSAVVQPGGSKNDDTVIDAANRLGLSMVITGRRHFLH
ncbi:MAG: bifunctional phosphoribosylaminoimidazolecarboxamide formyltransferase/IMP cyclohydrolase [Elusimicrobia bacterium]|nr:bifunctional phosphoribosylaminoimidazolecarboxamide formyltransferase/IMP cyclohydrolase [Elusimicrobiota bacterium]